MHGQFGFECAGDRDAFGSAFSEVLDALVFLSLVQSMKGSERRHTHVANTKEYNVYKICLARFMKKTFPKSIGHMTHYVLLHVSNVDNVT